MSDVLDSDFDQFGSDVDPSEYGMADVFQFMKHRDSMSRLSTSSGERFSTPSGGEDEVCDDSYDDVYDHNNNMFLRPYLGNQSESGGLGALQQQYFPSASGGFGGPHEGLNDRNHLAYEADLNGAFGNDTRLPRRNSEQTNVKENQDRGLSASALPKSIMKKKPSAKQKSSTVAALGTGRRLGRPRIHSDKTMRVHKKMQADKRALLRKQRRDILYKEILEKRKDVRRLAQLGKLDGSKSKEAQKKRDAIYKKARERAAHVAEKLTQVETSLHQAGGTVRKHTGIIALHAAKQMSVQKVEVKKPGAKETSTAKNANAAKAQVKAKGPAPKVDMRKKKL